MISTTNEAIETKSKSGLHAVPSPASPADPAASHHISFWRRIALAARIVRVRLRFIIVFAVAFFVVGRWDLLKNYWDKLTRPSTSRDTTALAVSLDTEYFCPMDPGVVSDWSGKCSVCNMTLVRRKKGEMVHLPDGVTARMQFSPRRMQLAGIETTPIAYQPLMRPIQAVGFVSGVERGGGSESLAKATVEARIFERDISFIAEGQNAELSFEAIPDLAAIATVNPIDPAQTVRHGTIIVSLTMDAPPAVRVGMSVLLRIHVPAANIEPFRSMPRTEPCIEPGSMREVYVCFEHPEVIKTKPADCPYGKNRLELRALKENERVVWWCPMHPKVISSSPGAECAECNGMKLLPRVTAFTPVGEVLAVPETAVIDTGARQVVYVDRGGGMFEGIDVKLGPRCGDYFPVIRGLEAGQRVVTSGSFLIDAETRLNPAAATSYFGAASTGTNSKDTP